MELVIEDIDITVEIEKHLRKIDRSDLLCRVDDPEDIEVSVEEYVKLLIEKYPVKKISTKVYKPNESPNKY